MQTTEVISPLSKYDVERWLEKKLVRFREYKFLTQNESTHWHQDPDGFVFWLKSQFGASPVTYRQYRKRFADYADRHGYVDVGRIIRESSVLAGKGAGKSKVAKSEGKLSKAKSSGAKSARQEKLKRIQESGSHGYEASLLGSEEISQFLITAKSKFGNGKPRYKEGELIAMLVRLGAMTGLRPVEWYGTYLAGEVRTHLRDEPYREVLVVKNAVKGQRQNRQGDYRYLSVAHWLDGEKEMLCQLLVEMESMRDNAESYLLSIGESNFIKTSDHLKEGFVNESSLGAIEVSGVSQGASHAVIGLNVDGLGASGVMGGDGDGAGTGASDGQINLYDLGRTIWTKTLRNLSDITGVIGRRAYGRRGLVTLYTGRHLYASEFRRAKLGDKMDLAEALGHSDIVNQTYYSDSLDLDEMRVMNWSLAKPLRIERAPIEDRADQRRLKGKLSLYKYLLANGDPTKNNAVSLIDAVPNDQLVELAKHEVEAGVKDGAASRLVVERGLGGSRLGKGYGVDDDLPIVDFDMDM